LLVVVAVVVEQTLVTLALVVVVQAASALPLDSLLLLVRLTLFLSVRVATAVLAAAHQLI
jgi:hypothetical protein